MCAQPRGGPYFTYAASFTPISEVLASAIENFMQARQLAANLRDLSVRE